MPTATPEQASARAGSGVEVAHQVEEHRSCETHRINPVEHAAVAGEQITIAKAGKPMVRLVRVGAEDKPPRTGFLAGQGRIPENFDALYSQEIAELFGEDS